MLAQVRSASEPGRVGRGQGKGEATGVWHAAEMQKSFQNCPNPEVKRVQNPELENVSNGETYTKIKKQTSCDFD